LDKLTVGQQADELENKMDLTKVEQREIQMVDKMDQKTVQRLVEKLENDWVAELVGKMVDQKEEK
jgi:hypothetical protein